MKRLVRLTITFTSLLGFTLATVHATPVGATGPAKARAITLAADKTAEITAKSSGETVVVKPTAEIVEITSDSYVRISKGKKSYLTKGVTNLCTKAGGCECAAGESLIPDLRPTQLGPGKIAIRLTGGQKVTIRGQAVEELCQKTDRCLLGTWNADLSGYLASLHMKVVSLSGIEKYTFTKKAAYADASNYKIVALDQKDPGNYTATLIVNGNARVPIWLTPQPGTLRLARIVGTWSVFVDAGPVHATIPASAEYSPFGPWATQTAGTYQCDPNGTTVQYTPDPRFGPITLTRVSS
jgi:hypothetical protein